MLFSVKVNEAVPAETPPGSTEPADDTEVDARAGMAAIAAPKVDIRIAMSQSKRPSSTSCPTVALQLSRCDKQPGAAT